MALKPYSPSRLSTAWLRWTGRNQWPTADAKVYSSEYANAWRSRGVGDHHAYSYVVGGDTFTSNFYDYGFETEEAKASGDRMVIRYDPQLPEKSYYPDQYTNTRFRVICFANGGGLGLVTSAFQFFRAWQGHR